MNFKGISIILIVSLMLILIAGAVSASEDVDGNETLEANDDSPVGDAAIQTSVELNETSVVGNDAQDDGNQIPAKNVKIPKIKTRVKADEKAVIYKKNTNYQIKLMNKTNAVLKNVKLKVTVKSGKTVKTFHVKTNSKGIAQFSTKGLGIGEHQVTITSEDGKYSVSKKTKILVGKLHTTTIRFRNLRVLKNGESVMLKVKYDDDRGKEVNIVFKGKAKYTKILKAKFIFYHPKTGKLVSKIEYAKFKNGKWEWPDRDYSFNYLIYKAKIEYISTKV